MQEWAKSPDVELRMLKLGECGLDSADVQVRT